MFKKSFKSIVVLSLLFLFTLLLVACGDNDDETVINDNGDPTTNDVDGTSIERVPITITWRGGGGDDDTLRDFLEEFAVEFEADNPDIKIVLEPLQAAEGDFFARLALSMQSPTTAPNIVAQDTFTLNADASAGLILNLTDRLEAWDQWGYYVEDLKEGVRAANGDFYALPATSDSRGLWFNRDVLADAGIEGNWQPETWVDILDAAELIRDNTDAVPLSFNVHRGNGEAVTMQTFLMFLHGTGEILFDFDEESWVVESQGFYDSLNFIYEVFNVRDLGPSMSVAMNTNYGSVMFQQMLPQGEVGIVLDGFWQGGLFREGGSVELEDPEGTLGFAAMPTQHGQAPGTVTLAGGWAWSIAANSENHDYSWRVLQAMGSMENQTRRVMLDGNLTVRSDSALDEAYASRPFIEQATSFLENTHFRPANDDYPTVSVEIQTIVEAVASGASTPAQAMADFADAIVRLVGEDNVIRR